MPIKLDESRYLSPEFVFNVERGKIAGWSVHEIDGSLLATSSSATTPITTAGVYMQPTAAVSLEVLSANANDTSAGTGARSVTITGLDASWAVQSVTVSLSGTTPVAVTGTWLRVYGFEVATTGTYSDYNVRNNYGTLTLRVASAGATWATILAESVTRGYGKSHIGAYTVPTGYRAYVLPHRVTMSAGGSVGVLVNAGPNTVAAPFAPCILRSLDRGTAVGSYVAESIHGPYTGPCDLVWIAIATTGTPTASVGAHILLESTS